MIKDMMMIPVDSAQEGLGVALKLHQMGVPVVDIDGEVIVGFDKIKIANLLNIKE